MNTTICTVRRRFNGGWLFVLLLIATNTTAFAGRPPVVSTKPIDYRIQYFTAPNSGPVSSIEDMNESGAVVGNYFTNSTHVSGYLYDPLVSVTSAINLHSQYLLPDGWYITYPRGINNFGAIVATVWHATYGERAMLLNPNGTQDQATGKRPATWLPDLAGSVSTHPGTINDQGDILLCAVFSTGEYVPFVYNPGIYDVSAAYMATELGFNTFDITNLDMSFRSSGQPLQFAGVLPGGNQSFHYTLGGSLQTFSMQSVSVSAINSNGTFCGRQVISTIGKGGKLTWSGQTFRYNPSTDTAVTSLGTAGYANDINDSNDVATSGKFLIHSVKGTLDLNTLVVGSAADVRYFKTEYSFESSLTQRTGNGFPVIGLKVGDLGCILVPSVPQQP